MDVPADLRDALEAALAATPLAELAPAVEGLIAAYRAPARNDIRSDAQPDGAILARPVDVLAYAAYRMPATYAAVRAALTQVVRAVPDLAPRRLLDLGGGTGAATWAATDVLAGLAELTVVDRVPAALRLGQRLAQARGALKATRWVASRMPAELSRLADTDLVTISYVLGELPPGEDAEVVAAAAAVAGAVLVVEPGTPAGYGRVLAARDTLLAAGLRVVAPCPHQARCPLTGSDWCHFAVRVNRSAVHRRAKGAVLGYEDEKFSYVAAVRDLRPGPAAARVLRHPSFGKGLVRLRLCTPAGAAGAPSGRAEPRVAETVVSRREGERYRAARDLAWGDAWVSPDDDGPPVRSGSRRDWQT